LRYENRPSARFLIQEQGHFLTANIITANIFSSRIREFFVDDGTVFKFG
jgi:hypothetical protein